MNKLRLPRPVIDLAITFALLLTAYVLSSLLLPHTGSENNSALVFVLSVSLISLCTEGYGYGIAASVVGTFCTNYFFMFPYSSFDISSAGYPVAMVSMGAISCIICALTGRVKKHAQQAEEREQKTKELYEINSRLEQEKMEMQIETAKADIRSNILMSVSHDLRTPLTAISGSAGLILEQGEKGCSSENLRLVQDIKTDAEWLHNMVENILMVTRLRDTGDSLKLTPEVMDEIFESTAVKLHRRFPGCEIATDPGDEVLIAAMDPTLIQQVLLNLLENSLRYSGTTEPPLLAARRNGHSVQISVSDKGKGLPEEILQQIETGRPVVVERRGDACRGMGIGLSVCQSILQAHHSRLQAVNPEQGGCGLFFELPLVEKSENDG